mgnify:CR=1 FL=1
MSTRLMFLRAGLKDFKNSVDTVVSCMSTIEGKERELETLESLLSMLKTKMDDLQPDKTPPRVKAKTVKIERKSIPCPWGCGYTFKPHGGKHFDIRPLKLHLTECCPETPTTIEITPYAKKGNTIPVGTNHVEALIACGFKKLKNDPTLDWRADFLRHKCQLCNFRHYNPRRLNKGQHTCTKDQYKRKRIVV